MKIYTIGFTKTTAEGFFSRLQKAGIKKVIDIRLNNVSQLAGFAKMHDLRYFLKAICGIEYDHRLDLAPTQEMLDAYKKNGGEWLDYEKRFNALIESRRIESTIDPSVLDGACLLCSEDKPHHCHRRLVAEYLQAKWGKLEIVNL